jgi:hypothetical protein
MLRNGINEPGVGHRPIILNACPAVNAAEADDEQLPLNRQLGSN